MIGHPSLVELQLGLHDRLAALFDVRRSELTFSMLSKPKVADGTTVVLIGDIAKRARAVVLCSPPAFAEAIEAEMSRTRQVKKMLGTAAAHPILDPLHEGRVHGLSYAVLPHCRRLSDTRPHWWIQRAALVPALLDWLLAANQRSVCAVDSSEMDIRFGVPLQHVATLAALSERVRSAAVQASSRLESGAWTPKHVLMHGDLWKANVLLRPAEDSRLWRRRKNHFAIIDWPGSELRGYAIYDLVRLAQSIRLRDRELRREVDRHCGILACDAVDAKSHLLAALGHIGMNLGCFSAANYARMAQECLHTFERAVHE